MDFERNPLGLWQEFPWAALQQDVLVLKRVCAWTAHPKQQGTALMSGEQHWAQLARLRLQLGGVKRLCKTSLGVRTPLHLCWRDRSVSHTDTFCSWLQVLTFTFLSLPPSLSLIPTVSQESTSCLCSGRVRGGAGAASLTKCKFGAAGWHCLCVLHPWCSRSSSHILLLWITLQRQLVPSTFCVAILNSGQCGNSVDATGNICPN